MENNTYTYLMYTWFLIAFWVSRGLPTIGFGQTVASLNKDWRVGSQRDSTSLYIAFIDCQIAQASGIAKSRRASL